MIRTRRLVLRPAQMDDFEALHEIFADPEVMRYWDRPPHAPEDTRNFLRGLIDGDPATQLELIVERDDRVVGRVGMWRLAEIGYLFHRDVWGQGIGSEAVGALVAEVFARFPEVDEVTAEIDPRNHGSDRLLHKLGFHVTGEAERTLELNGEWCDSRYFALPRAVFEDRKTQG